MITLQVMNDAADPKREQDIYVDPDYVNAMAEWLIDQQNKTSGSWSEISEIYDMKLMVSDYFVSRASKIFIIKNSVIYCNNNNTVEPFF